MKVRAYTIALILTGLSLFFSAETIVFAQYDIEQIPGGDQVFGDFVVGPTKIDLTVEPGTERVVELLVTNRMGERRVFNLEVEDTRGSNDPQETIVLLGDDRGPYSLKDYLSFPQPSFELGQGERARIPVTVSVPANAQPGGLYGSVLVTTASVPSASPQDEQGARAGAVVVSRIGALFFVTVPGEVKKEGALSAFTTMPEGSTFFSKGPIQFQALFENKSSVHLNPYGTISIKNILGEEVGVVVAEPWFAMPDSVRRREVSWDRPFLFGYYTAEASINRGYDNIVDTKSVSFFVIPWMLVLAGFVGLALFFFGIRYIGRTFQISRR